MPTMRVYLSDGFEAVVPQFSREIGACRFEGVPIMSDCGAHYAELEVVTGLLPAALAPFVSHVSILTQFPTEPKLSIGVHQPTEKLMAIVEKEGSAYRLSLRSFEGVVPAKNLYLEIRGGRVPERPWDKPVDHAEQFYARGEEFMGAVGDLFRAGGEAAHAQTKEHMPKVRAAWSRLAKVVENAIKEDKK